MRLLRSALVEIRRRFICPGHRGGRRATLRASKGGSRGSPRSRLWPRSDRRSCSHRWAKALGATVIGSTSSDAKAEQARRVGCDHIVISSRESIPEAVRRFTEGRGVQVLYDAVGKDIFEDSINLPAPRGHLVSFGQASGDVGAYSIDKSGSRSVTLSRPNYGHYTDTPAKLKFQSERLFAALQSGILVAERPRPYALMDAGVAHGNLEGRKKTGALVLIP